MKNFFLSFLVLQSCASPYCPQALWQLGNQTHQSDIQHLLSPNPRADNSCNGLGQRKLRGSPTIKYRLRFSPAEP